MKKIVALFIASLTTFSLIGCGEEQEHLITYETAEYVGLSINEETVDCVGVFTQYTNNSSESACAADWIECRAYQNGQELSPIVPAEDETEGYIQCDAYIQSGETKSVIWLFTLNDESTVTVEIGGQEYEVEVSN